jgi:transcriptional regulator with XRE-family HTH domain
MGAIKKTKAARYVPARVRVRLTVGQQVRNVRELQEMTQGELAKSSGVPQPTISSIEADRVSIGVERAEKLARALKVHPAVLLWPNGWDATVETKRAG